MPCSVCRRSSSAVWSGDKVFPRRRSSSNPSVLSFDFLLERLEHLELRGGGDAVSAAATPATSAAAALLPARAVLGLVGLEGVEQLLNPGRDGGGGALGLGVRS